MSAPIGSNPYLQPFLDQHFLDKSFDPYSHFDNIADVRAWQAAQNRAFDSLQQPLYLSPLSGINNSGNNVNQPQLRNYGGISNPLASTPFAAPFSSGFGSPFPSFPDPPPFIIPYEFPSLNPAAAALKNPFTQQQTEKAPAVVKPEPPPPAPSATWHEAPRPYPGFVGPMPLVYGVVDSPAAAPNPSPADPPDGGSNPPRAPFVGPLPAPPPPAPSSAVNNIAGRTGIQNHTQANLNHLFAQQGNAFNRVQQSNHNRPQQMHAPARTPPQVAPAGNQVEKRSPERKVEESIKRSVQHLRPELQREVGKLLTPDNLKLIAGGAVLYAGSHYFGVGEAADAVLAIGAAIGLGKDSIEVAKNLYEFGKGAVHAKTEADLDRAGQHLAGAISLAGVDGALAYLGNKGSKDIKHYMEELKGLRIKFPKAQFEEMLNLLKGRSPQLATIPVRPQVGRPSGITRPPGMAARPTRPVLPTRPITASNLRAITVPGVKDGAFAKWFNSLSKSEMKHLWSDKSLRTAVEARLRSPGGFHEWLPVSRAPKFREWGVSAEQIWDLRSKTKEVEFINPAGRHGGPGSVSNEVHNQLFELIDRAKNFDEYKGLLQGWAQKRLTNGINDLPAGLRP